MSLTTAGMAPAANRGGKDIAFAVGIVLILCLFFLPVPAFMIDFGLALSIALAVLILMVALWIHKPLEFSAFPTVLLSRFHLANQRIGFLRFAAYTDSRGVWHGGKVSGYGER